MKTAVLELIDYVVGNSLAFVLYYVARAAPTCTLWVYDPTFEVYWFRKPGSRFCIPEELSDMAHQVPVRRWMLYFQPSWEDAF